MKTTYLVYKQIDGAQRLVPAMQAEWDAIIINFSFHSRPLPHKEQRIAVMVDKQFIQHILLLSIRVIVEYPPHLAVQKSRFSYMAA